jgi:hypothetical protein
MKQKLVIALLGLWCINTAGAAETNNAAGGGDNSDGAVYRHFGAGLILGEPVGASLKYHFNERMAVDGALGWSWRGQDNFHLHADFLYHWPELIPVGDGQLPVYVGGGFRWKLIDRDDDRFGLRIPAGIAYVFERIPVDVFCEAAPILDVTPKTRWEFTFGVGARYWF